MLGQGWVGKGVGMGRVRSLTFLSMLRVRGGGSGWEGGRGGRLSTHCAGAARGRWGPRERRSMPRPGSVAQCPGAIPAIRTGAFAHCGKGSVRKSQPPSQTQTNFVSNAGERLQMVECITGEV